MLSTALTPRWLLGALALVAFTVAAVFLGAWQWQRTQSILAAERAAAQQPVPIAEVLPAGSGGAGGIPDEVIGRPVVVAGTYVPQLQAAVVNRSFDGRPGAWLVTGLRQASGDVTAVLRGWVPTPDDPASAVPEGPVEVTGVLHPNEIFYAGADTPVGTVAAIDSAHLSELWGQRLTPGFVMLASQRPSTEPAPQPVPPTVQTGNVAFPLQNFFYAFQWWLFAVFAWGVYFRWLWLETHRGSLH